MFKPIPIGTAEITYDEAGVPIAATFQPALRVTDIAVLTEELKQHTAKSAEDVKQNASLVLAEWFTHLDSIELADRETGEIVTTVEECLSWSNGRPQKCKVTFAFVPRKASHA